MSVYLAGILMLVMLAICLVLILLVLVQLPKKDAGAGLAFGSGAADALFGAGSGNALTKITKYGTVAFLVVAVLLAALEDSIHNTSKSNSFTKEVQNAQQSGLPMQAPAPAPAPAPAKTGTNVLSTMPLMAPSSTTSAPSTPAPTAPAAAGTNAAK